MFFNWPITASAAANIMSLAIVLSLVWYYEAFYCLFFTLICWNVTNHYFYSRKSSCSHPEAKGARLPGFAWLQPPADESHVRTRGATKTRLLIFCFLPDAAAAAAAPSACSGTFPSVADPSIRQRAERIAPLERITPVDILFPDQNCLTTLIIICDEGRSMQNIPDAGLWLQSPTSHQEEGKEKPYKHWHKLKRHTCFCL